MLSISRIDSVLKVLVRQAPPLLFPSSVCAQPTAFSGCLAIWPKDLECDTAFLQTTNGKE